MTSAHLIPARIIEWIRREGLAAGSHLAAQQLADQLGVSRSPVNDALALLHEKGILQRERNRGYFVAQTLTRSPSDEIQALGLAEADVVTSVYFRIADERLQGLLPDKISEQGLRQRYGLTSTQLNAVLSRVAQEGWAERTTGYGWIFSSMLTTPDSLLQSYRLRLALEPAALLEPGYRLAPAVLARCRAAEQHLLQGGIETDSADQIHTRGVQFHESLVAASGNAFFIDAVKRVNRVRRLLSYRSTQDRTRYQAHCRQHLQILELLEQERHDDASQALRAHLLHTLEAMTRIADMLQTGPKR